MKELDKIQYWGILTLIFSLPLFFLSTTSDFFDFQKLTLLVVGVSILTVFWALGVFLSSRLTFNMTPFDLPVLAVAAVFILSTFLRTPNKIDAFINPGLTALILALTVLYFLITQTVPRVFWALRGIIWALLASGVVVSVVIILASVGLFEGISALPFWAKARTFSPLGAPLPTAVFLLALLPLGFGQVLRSYKDSKFIPGAWFLGVVVIFALGILAVATVAGPGKPAFPKILPNSTAWAIAVETLKVSPFGVGPGNFLTAFNQFRPVTYNQTEFWNLRFASSSNWYLQVFTEVGIIGLAAFLFLSWRTLFLYRDIHWIGSLIDILSARSIAFASIFILFLFLAIPAPLALLFVFYTLIGIAATTLGKEHVVSFGTQVRRGASIPSLVLLLTVGVTLAVLFWGGKIYWGEVIYKRALDAVLKNDGKAVYELLVAAVNQNPRVARYHTSLAQTDLAIVNNIATKEEITDQDRKNISSLVQQAIEQGKIAVSLNPFLSINWEVLGGIYRALMPIAQGSGDLAVATYTQAVNLEPANPLLRITLGGIYYSAKNYEAAVREFERAIIVKPDFANAHYNLSAALREKGDIGRAIAEMEGVLSLVQADTQDYEIAQKELESLKSKLPPVKPGQAASGGETLQAPQPSPAPLIEPPIELSEEAAPPSPPPSPKETNNTNQTP